MSSRTAWSTKQVPRKPGLHKETKTKPKQTTTKKTKQVSFVVNKTKADNYFVFVIIKVYEDVFEKVYLCTTENLTAV